MKEHITASFYLQIDSNNSIKVAHFLLPTNPWINIQNPEAKTGLRSGVNKWADSSGFLSHYGVECERGKLQAIPASQTC